MSDTPSLTDRPARRLLTIGLRTLLLLVAVAASLVALRNSRLQTQQKIEKVKQLKKTVGELAIADRNQFGLAVESGPPMWVPASFDLQVYLPSGMSYEVCWNTETMGESSLPEATGRQSLEPGYHDLRLFAVKPETRWNVVLAVNAEDHLLFEMDESVIRDEVTMHTSMNPYVESYQQPTAQPLELFRGFFASGRGRSWPQHGAAIWIEAVKK